MKGFFALALLAMGVGMYVKPGRQKQQQVMVNQPAKTQPYDSVKAHVNRLRQQLQRNINGDTSLQPYFVSAIADSIIPYWYATPWDFNGITQTPGKGAIACGYFISTVLRDAGLAVNRVKMGQSNSEDIIHVLAEKKDTKLFYDKPLSFVIDYIKSRGAGLYIIGLDCHVGFILKDAKGCWFIHSKWYAEKGVVKEDAGTSSVLYNSKYRMVGKISNNRKLLQAWLNGTTVAVKD